MADEWMVVLNRSENLGFGFSLLGKAGLPHVIYEIEENSPAAECGEVEAGDVLLNVNGTDVNRFTTKEVLKCLRLSTDPVTLKLKRDPQIKAHLRRYLSSTAERHHNNINTSPNHNSQSSTLSSSSGPSSQYSISGTDSSISPPSSRTGIEGRGNSRTGSGGSAEALLGHPEEDRLGNNWPAQRIPPKQPKFEAYMMTGELMLNLSPAERSSELQTYQTSYQGHHSLQGHHPHHHHHAPRHRHAQRYNSTPASPNDSRLPNNAVREVQRYNSTPATAGMGESRLDSETSNHDHQGFPFNSTPSSPASDNHISPSHLPHSSQNGQHCQIGNRVPPQACVRTSRSEDHLQEWSLSAVAVEMDDDVTSSLNTLLDTREPPGAPSASSTAPRVLHSPQGSMSDHPSHTGPNSPSECGPDRIVWTYNAPVSSASERIMSHYNGSSSTTATSNSTSISDGVSPQRSISPASPTSVSSSVMSSTSLSRRSPPPTAISDSRNITNVGVGVGDAHRTSISQHHRFNGDASISEAMSSVSSPDYQDLLERSELLDERNRMQLSDPSDSDSTILASEPAHQHRIVIQVKGANSGNEMCIGCDPLINGTGSIKLVQNGGNIDSNNSTPEAYGYQELRSDDILNNVLADSVSDEGSDVDSLHSFHYSPKAVDIPSAVRLAKRLYQLDGFKKSDVSRHLSKNNEFAKVVAEEYVRHFDFQNLGLDAALRLFLARFALTGETQERERVLVHFSRRYLDCNPGSFSSQDAVHTLTCAIMLLNTDLHGLGAGNGAGAGSAPSFRRMTCAEFIDNLTGLNDGGDFPKDVLKRLYHAIKNRPLQWAVDAEGGSDTDEAKAGASATVNSVSNNNGNSGPPIAQTNPFLDVPDQSRAIEYKKGYVMRKCCKDANSKRTPFGKRSWKMFYCTLRDLVLYLHKDEHGFRRPQLSDDLYNAIRIHHALATKANDYTKKQHVFRLQTADQAEYLFQTSDSKELNSWVDTINFVCAAFSAQPLAGAVGSQRKFQRPLLPCSHTKLSLRDQLRDHEDRCAGLEAELHTIRTSSGANTPYQRDKEAYLQFELKRYKVYAQNLRWRTSGGGAGEEWSAGGGVTPPPLPDRPPPREAPPPVAP